MSNAGLNSNSGGNPSLDSNSDGASGAAAGSSSSPPASSPQSSPPASSPPSSPPATNQPSATSIQGSNSPPPRSTSSASNSQKTGGSNAGIIAGAAVGAAVVASLLTLFIIFMFLRHTKKKKGGRTNGKRRSGGGAFMDVEKSLPRDPSGDGDPTSATRAWQKHLPQSADDKAIRSSVKTLFDQVEVHVENFYRNSPVQTSERLQEELRLVDSPHLSESIVTLLPRVRSQTALIKHCLLSYCVASISTEDDSVQSLLPADYTTMPRLAQAKSSKKPAFAEALSQWRVLSAYLRPAPKDDQTYLSQRDANVAGAATAFTNAFSAWASDGYSDQARRQNMEEIFKGAADVGILLFSQPSSFRFHWDAPQQQRQEQATQGASPIVVTPALLKIADENAQMLERPQTMIHMTTQGL